MWGFQINGINARAYADDIIWIWDPIQQLSLSIDIVFDFIAINEINPENHV